VQTVLYPIAKAILHRLTKCVFAKAENWVRFYEPPGIIISPRLSTVLVWVVCVCNDDYNWLTLFVTVSSVFVTMIIIG